MYSRSILKSPLHIGLLVIRIGIGASFIAHGLPKLLGGPETWEQLGGAVQYIGIDFAPMFFGFMAAISETFGGLLLMLGLFFRPILVLLISTMVVAMFYHIGNDDGFSAISHPLELGILFAGLMFTGSGKFSLDKILFKKKRRR